MERRLSARVQSISPSATVAMDTKTKQLIKEGKPVINMSVGEPDFDTPVAAAFAGIKAIADGNTRYTPVAGTVELRKAIADKLKAENGLDYTADQIVVSSGAKQSLFNIFYTICEDGDEVILPAPFWVSYPEEIKMSGAKPVVVTATEQAGFKITPDQLRQAITPRTRAIMLNSPSNPTGAVYSEAELRALGQVLLDHPNIYLVTDEIYERLVYGVKHASLPAILPELISRSLVVNGFSKAFAMTGWRLGYVAAPLDIAKAITSMQSHSSHSPSTITQAAGVAALGAFDPKMVEAFNRRRDTLLAGLTKIEGITCVIPEGAFYAFPNVSKFFGKSYKGTVIDSANTFSNLLLDNELVSTVPGESFGAPNNIRLSYAVSDEQIGQALDRINRFVAEIQ